MAEKRLKKILQASIVAILVNVALGIFKAIVGLVSHSVAIMTDAINNFTDAASSFITILSARLSAKDPDKKHPFGYGRTEYLGTFLIGGLILYAGITAFTESVKKIIHPEAADYSIVTLVIIIVAVLAKVALTMYIVRVGKSTKSDSLIASGKEATADIAISIATVLAAVLYLLTEIAIEAWLGVVIAIVIIKSGLETLKETVDKILGTGADAALVQDIKKAITANEGVNGAYDLILHNYGPDFSMASVHVEVADTLTAGEFDTLTRKIQNEILEKFGVFLTAIGLYSVNSQDDEVIRIREEVRKIALSEPAVHQMHGFYLDRETKQMRFDLVISFEVKDRRETYREVMKRIQEAFPEYQISAGMDTDFNECV